MYYLINRHIDIVLEATPEKSVADYDWLVNELTKRNVATDSEYQQKYKTYWSMNSAHLAANFYAAYFGALERLKRTIKPDLRQLCRCLYRTPTQRENRRSLQFSFATKLIHMVNRDAPIYDSMVRQFFYIREPSRKRQINDRIDDFLTLYSFLAEEYERVRQEGVLDGAISAFQTRFNPNQFSNNKVIDLLIWRFTDIALKGGFIQKTFRYG